MAVLSFDDSNFQKLYAEMDPKRRLQALRGGFRREANKVRRAAISNLRNSGLQSNRNLEKGIWSKVFRYSGFSVRITTTDKGKGFYTTKKQGPRPVLRWAESGTKERHTKSKTRFFVRTRKGHPTGRMRRYAFMTKTRRETVNSVTEDLHNEVLTSVEKIAKKYGCK